MKNYTKRNIIIRLGALITLISFFLPWITENVGVYEEKLHTGFSTILLGLSDTPDGSLLISITFIIIALLVVLSFLFTHWILRALTILPIALFTWMFDQYEKSGEVTTGLGVDGLKLGMLILIISLFFRKKKHNQNTDMAI